MSDLRIITTRMTDTLVNMHHHRIKYQWQAKRAEEFGVPSGVVTNSAPHIEVAAPASPSTLDGLETTRSPSADAPPDLARPRSVEPED
jgi:hypothetical protein